MSEHDHRPVYWAIAGVLIVLTVIGLITYGAGSDDREAQDKAQQLTQEFEAAGLPVFASQDQITAALGNDGGAVCDDPTAALRKATQNALMYNGASFVGMRPVLVDREILAGEALILKVYCPDELEKYQDRIDDLKFDDTVKD